MRLAAIVLFLGSSIFSKTAAQEQDNQVAASWEVSGTCAYFFQKPGKWSILKTTCIKYCETHGGHGYSECDYSPYKNINIEKDMDKSLINKDGAGDLWVPTKCKCSNPDVEGISVAIFDIVAEGLSKLDNIICAVMLEAFKTILDVGIMLVPGGAPANAAMKAVQGAKSFVENGMAAADFFGNWVGKACGVPDWNFDLWGSLTGAPDSMGKSIGCKRKNKAECKKMDSIPDPTKKPDPPKPNPTNKPEPPKTTKKDNPPPASKSEDPKTTTTPAQSKSPSTTAKPSSTVSSSSCRPATGTQTAASCEQVTPCKISNPDTGVEDTLLRRDGRRSPRRIMLEKRDKKKGKPCAANPDYKQFELESDEYPSNGQLDANVAAYGWVDQNNYCEYGWQSGTKKKDGSLYDSEHVMEWQIVTDFFAKMQAKGGTKYTHPKPAQVNQKVDFCTYWIESWSLDPQQAFSIDNGPALSPWKHIAAAYPSNKNHKAEMIALQRKINSPAKANLFTDTVPMVWNEDTMNKYVKSKDNRLKVLERLRLALGARRYLTEPEVKKIFKSQKERMGTVLGKLDILMSSHPREVTNATTGNKTVYQAWAKQNLATEWNSFIDTKWDNMVTKHNKVMNTWVNNLDDEHCQSQAKMSSADKDFCTKLKKLQSQYSTVSAFSKPW